MFCASLLDAIPELLPELMALLENSCLRDLVSVRLTQSANNGFSGKLFKVTAKCQAAAMHRRYADILTFLDAAGLPKETVRRSKEMFHLLATVEGEVHGVGPDQVTFHEVGAWDSIADMVSAAFLIERAEVTWSCSPLPFGGGRVQSAHGVLPLPAPATAKLLQGFELRQDGIPGERVTPTGAAILRHLAPSRHPGPGTARIISSGMGLGSQNLPGIGNFLRALVLEPACHPPQTEEMVVVQFEIDDQTPEDLAVALDNLRRETGVRELVQVPVFAKKNRMATQVQVLVDSAQADSLIQACFMETTTLGLRWHVVARQSLPRQASSINTGDLDVRIKRATRPDGSQTVKAEMDDLKQVAGGHFFRQALRRRAEANEDDESGEGGKL